MLERELASLCGKEEYCWEESWPPYVRGGNPAGKRASLPMWEGGNAGKRASLPM